MDISRLKDVIINIFDEQNIKLVSEEEVIIDFLANHVEFDLQRNPGMLLSDAVDNVLDRYKRLVKLIKEKSAGISRIPALKKLENIDPEKIMAMVRAIEESWSKIEELNGEIREIDPEIWPGKKK